MASLETSRKEYLRISEWSFWAQLLFLVMAVITGVGYAREQPDEAAFVTILSIAAAILIVAEHVTRSQFFRHGVVFLKGEVAGDHLDDALKDSHRRVSRTIYSAVGRIAFGLAYGALLAAAPYVLGIGENAYAQARLAIFLFMVNFVTGNAAYSWVAYLLVSRTLARNVELSVWNTRSDTAEAYVALMLTVAGFASVFASLSMSAVVLSAFNEAFYAYVYVIGCIALMSVSVAYVYVPLSASLAASKREWTERVGERMHEVAEAMVQDAQGDRGEALAAEMERLTKLRDLIGDVSILPLRRMSLAAFAVMASVLTHPLLIDAGKRLVEQLL